MGKNQACKAMERAKVGSSSAAPDEIEDGMVDGSFHTPEWHAARLASLKTTRTITWEEYKKQKEEELKKGELEADTDKLMREYRAQLDAERALKRTILAKNLEKHSRRRSSDSSSSSNSSSRDEEESRRSRSSSKISKRERKHTSRSRHSSQSKDEADGPVPLSEFVGSRKS